MLILCFLFPFINVVFGDCKLDKPSGSDEEKSLLNALAPLNGIVFETKDEDYTYKVSLCSQMKNEKINVGAIQYKQKKNDSHVLGRYDMSDIIRGKNWIFLSYNGGEHYKNPNHCDNSSRMSKIMIICDKEAVGSASSLRFVKERKSNNSNCHYLFELSSNVSCTSEPNPPPEQLSSGSIFCILFFTVAIVYLVCGFLYQRLFVGAKGMEQIPNYSFWMNFGSLQADGCDYFCRWGHRRQSQAYRGIDDHLRTEEDRDEQLLN